MDGPNIYNRAAFSFAEIIIVVLVIGILAAAAVPKYQESLAINSLSSSARRVAADIRLTKSTAMTNSANRTIKFSTEDSTYQLIDIVDASTHSADNIVELNEALYRSFISAALFEGASDLTFNGFGLPGASGFVRLNSGKYYQQITVSATGVVKIQPMVTLAAEDDIDEFDFPGEVDVSGEFDVSGEVDIPGEVEFSGEVDSGAGISTDGG